MPSGRKVLSPALALAAAACTFSLGVSIREHELARPVPPDAVTASNVEEMLERGWVPEAHELLAGDRGATVPPTLRLRLLGEALLERGSFREARAALDRAHAEEGHAAARAPLAWMLSQASWWEDDLLESARWARLAQAEGLRIPEGWIAFLLSASGKKPYSGPAPGARLETPIVFGRPDLVRVPLRMGGAPPELFVLDSGASVSLVTESAAKRLGIERVPGTETKAHGLHESRIPLHFGWADAVELGGVTLRDVPFGIVPDDALTFATRASGTVHHAGVIGAHAMKNLDWRISYAARRLEGVRLDARAARGGPGQNLFLRGFRPMVRTSFDREPWFLFVLDTGSETTMVTRGGVRRARAKDPESISPMTIRGIGQSRVSWSKMSRCTVGLDRFMVVFDDLVLKEEGEGLEDGVLGSSFLSRFDVEILFGAMRVRLERPYERRLKALESQTPSR